MPIPDALESLRRGGFILLHDSEKRENEFDLVIAAQFATPGHVGIMRRDAGGLLCVALDHDYANTLGLQYLHHMLQTAGVPQGMILGRAPYGDHPTFSIPVNHKDTYTGVTDNDRARTITEMSRMYGREDAARAFAESFKTPGHVPLLIASGRLQERMGHTELSVYMTMTAGLKPIAAICEMVDSVTHQAVDLREAEKYSIKNKIPLVMASDIAEHAGVDLA